MSTTRIKKHELDAFCNWLMARGLDVTRNTHHNQVAQVGYKGHRMSIYCRREPSQFYTLDKRMADLLAQFSDHKKAKAALRNGAASSVELERATAAGIPTSQPIDPDGEIVRAGFREFDGPGRAAQRTHWQVWRAAVEWCMAGGIAPTSHDDWRKYATETESTAQAVIERHRRELQHVLRQYGEQTERQPLTNEQVFDLVPSTGIHGPIDQLWFARAIERAHGIVAARPTDGCGACGDACAERSWCRLAEESPPAWDGKYLCTTKCLHTAWRLGMCKGLPSVLAKDAWEGGAA